MKLHHISLTMVLFLLPATAMSADSIILRNFTSHDSGDVSQREHTLGYLKSFSVSSSAAEIGIHAGYKTSDEFTTEQRFSVYGVSGEIEHPEMGTLSSEFKYYSSDNWSTESFVLGYQQLNHDKFNYEANFERSIVDSITAINSEILVDTYSASVDLILNSAFTLVGAGIFQDFSDRNRKSGGLAKLVYVNPNHQNFSTSLNYRQMEADFKSPAYFSPETQKQLFMDFDYSKAVLDDNFLVSATFGLGTETIEHFDYRNTRKLINIEFRVRGWFTDRNGITARFGCNNTGDDIAVSDSNSYQYCYGFLNFTHRLQ